VSAGRADGEIDEILRIARLAAACVAEVYRTPFTVEMKGPNDPVTIADRRANDLICAALAASFPGDAVLAEESVPEDPAEIARLVAKERVFFVDPLDGTREFADRNGEFAVMIGLAVRGRAEAGVLVLPEGNLAPGHTGAAGGPGPQRSSVALCGRVGAGAFAEDAAGARHRLGVSAVRDPREATLLVSRSHRPAIVAPLCERLGLSRVVPCGSVGVKISRIVTGGGDLYVHGGAGCKRWDTCAPEAVLVAAGGRVSDLAGAPLDYASPDLAVRTGLVASNGALHDAVVAVTRAL
jgi:3'(2'), 5'-bisphosphate nucleotidase